MARAFLFFGPGRDSSSRLIRRWFRWRRIIAVGVVVFLLGVSLLALFARSQAAKPPEWWAPPVAAPRTQAAAEHLEHLVVNQTHEVRDLEGAWTLALSEEEVNAWLATRLPEWLAAQDRKPAIGPTRSQVMFRDDRLYAAAEIQSGGFDGKVVTVGVEPAILETGELALTVHSASMGRLGVPAGWALQALAASAPPGVRVDLEHGRVIIDTPTLRLADGRHVTIAGVKVEEGMLTVRARTQGR